MTRTHTALVIGGAIAGPATAMALRKAGILAELRKREHYEKPSVKRKKKAIAAKKRALRRVRHAF